MKEQLSEQGGRTVQADKPPRQRCWKGRERKGKCKWLTIRQENILHQNNKDMETKRKKELKSGTEVGIRSVREKRNDESTDAEE